MKSVAPVLKQTIHFVGQIMGFGPTTVWLTEGDFRGFTSNAKRLLKKSFANVELPLYLIQELPCLSNWFEFRF